ncbi:helix-turn-helix transcriptional regulator [Acinetobacter tandoii]|nr:helix-turn-helix transcriptional regulator [Acinetobacter tandoii]
MFILHSKLSPPIVEHQNAMDRHELMDSVARHGLKNMLFIHAAAGYGKTTFMGQIAQQQEKQNSSIHWLTLDEDDNDPIRLYQYLWYVLFDELPQVNVAEAQITKHDVYVLTKKLNQSEQQKTLFIDDLERLTNLNSLNLIWWLYLNLPQHCQLVVASRIRPAWSFTKEILDGRIHIFTEEQLCLKEIDVDELIHFFHNKNQGLEVIDRATAQQLIAKTEGWITGVQLAKIYVQDNVNIEPFVQSIAGTHNQIADYLNEQVFLQQTEEIQYFLMQISILRKISLPLIQELTGEGTAQKNLALMTQKGLFIQAMDEQRIWYRVHPLFSDFLSSRFKLMYPEAYTQLHIQAAQWYKNNREAMEAIYHAQQVDDTELMAQLLESFSRELVLEGRLYTLLEWGKQLPESVLVRFPKLLYDIIWSLLLTHQIALANHYLQFWYSNDQHETLLTHQDQLGLAPFIAVLEDKLGIASDLAVKSLKSLPVTSYFTRGPLMGICMLHDICRGNIIEARKQLVETRIINIQGRNLYGLILVDCIDALCDYLLGDLALAEQKFIQMGHSEEYRALGLDDDNKAAVAAISSSFKADLYYEMNKLALAEAALTDFNGGTQLVLPDMVIVGYILNLRLAQLKGNPEVSQRYLHEIQLKSSLWSLPRLAQTIECYQQPECETLATQNQAQSAQVEDISPEVNVLNFTHLLRGDDLIHYRRQILNGNTEEVTAFLLQQQQSFKHYPLRQARLKLLLTLAYHQQQKLFLAFEQLEQALLLIMPTGALRLILDEPPIIWGVITQLYKELQSRKQDKNLPLLKYIQYLFEVQQADVDAELNPTTIEPKSISQLDQFSKRELQILAKVGEGLTDAEIAEKIFLSVNTIKWHLRNIYSKLMVRSRLEAAKVAKAKGLIV